jgi:hypothetical protein
MRATPVLVGLLLVASGCLGGAQDPDPTHEDPLILHAVLHRAGAFLNASDLPPALADLAFLDAVWLPVDGRDAREPTVGVDSKGAIYYTARDYSGGNTPATGTTTPVMKSEDGGLTWKDVSPRLPNDDRQPVRSGDPMIWVDPWTDRIFQIELYDLVCNWLVFSDDAGTTWTSNPKACGTFVVDHQTIGAGPARSPTTPLPVYRNVVYVCVNQVADSNCAKSLDGGLTFGPSVVVYPGVRADTGGFCGGIHGHVMVGPDGTVYLPRNYCGDAFIAISRDDGATWELRDVDGGVGSRPQDPNLAFDGAGNVYYLWVGGDQQIHLTWSKDQGRTWSRPARVTPPDVTAANHPSITAGSDGRIGFVYSATKDPVPSSGGDWSGVTWDAYMGVSLDATSDPPTFAVVRTNPEGDPVYRGNCIGQRCGYIREFLDASVAPDGSFYGAFVDACLTVEERKYAVGPGDCNQEPGNYGEGNGHLGYVGRTVAGPSLYLGEREITGGS